MIEAGWRLSRMGSQHIVYRGDRRVCVTRDHRAMEASLRLYENAGYRVVR